MASAAGKLEFSLVLSAQDKASKVVEKVGGVFASVKAAGDKLKSIDLQKLHDARENVDAFNAKLGGAISSIWQAGASVDSALGKLDTTIQGTEGVAAGALERMRAAALDWSMAHQGSTESYLRASASMLAQLKDEDGALAATKAAMRLSAATTSDAAVAAKGLAVVYAQMGDKTADVGTEFGRLSDVLVRAGQVYSQLDVTTLFDPLKDAAPAARAAGVSLEQVAVALGQLNAAGIQGGEAGAGLKSVLESLGPASDKLKFAIARTASGGVDLIGTLRGLEAKYGSIEQMTPKLREKLADAFGPDAMRGLTFMLGQTDSMNSALGQITDSAGAAAAAQAAVEGRMSAQAAVAQQQLEALKVEMSTGLLPALQEILPHITSLVVTVSGFVRENPQLVATIGTIAVGALAFGQIASAAMSFAGVLFPLVGGLVSMAGSIGTFAAGLMSSLLPALGAAITAAWSFTAALLANPITWIVIAIVAAAALIYIYWEPISEFFAWLWDGISSGFLAAWAVLEGAWDAAVSFFTGIFGEIKSAFQDSFVGGIFTALKMLNPMYWIVRAFGAIQPYLVALWPKLRDGAIDGLKAMGAAFLSLGAWIWEALQALPGKLWSWTTSLFTLLKDAAIAGIRLQVEGWKMLGSWVLDALVALPGKLVAFWQGVGATIAGWVSNFGQVIWSGITKDVDRVKSWLSSFSLRDAGANIVRTIAEGIASAAGSAYEAMQKVVQKVRNLLPFSPAKEGPLRDLHRVKLVETVAEAVRPTPLVQAMSGAAAAAMVAMQSVPPPSEPVPIPASIRSVSAERGSAAMSSSGAGAAPIILNVTLSFGGGDVRANADYFERWLSTPGNPARLARRLKEEARIDSRRGLT